MPRVPDDDDLVLPPLPLATGARLPDPDGRRITAVALVVTTEDGAQTRVELRPEHGAWWAPAPPPEG